MRWRQGNRDGAIRGRFCDSVPARKEEAQQALEKVRQWTAQAGLTAASGQDTDRGRHPDRADSIFSATTSSKARKWPRRKSDGKFKDTIRAKTQRTNGQSLPTIIEDVNRTLVRLV